MMYGYSRKILSDFPDAYYKLIREDQDMKVLITAISSVLIIFSIKGIFLQARNKQKREDGILLENSNGKLLISMETLENLVRDISKGVDGTESVTSKVRLNEYNMIIVDIDAVVYQDATIKTVTTELQEKIQTAIKQASDLEVQQVNVNIKNISNKTNPKTKAAKKEESLKLDEEEKKEKAKTEDSKVIEDKTDKKSKDEKENKEKVETKTKTKAKSKK